MTEINDPLASSIANIKDLREMVFYLGAGFTQPDTCIMDIGCGNGSSIAQFVQACDETMSFNLVDNDSQALHDASERFKDDKRVIYTQHDLTGLHHPLTAFSTSLVLAVSTLHYLLSVANRARLLRNIYQQLLPGGALILVERVVGTGELEDLFHNHNVVKVIENTSQQFCTSGDAGKLNMPLSADTNLDMLKEAGFIIVDCFYRYLNYAGWIALKDE